MKIALVAVAMAICVMGPKAMAQDREGCILAEPEAIFKNAGFRYNKRTANWQERLSLSNDVKVRVEVFQCEYVERKWMFETKSDPDLVKGSFKSANHYERAIQLLSQIESYPKTNVTSYGKHFLDFGDVMKSLRDHLKLVANPRLRTEIVFRQIPGGHFTETVTVDYSHNSRTQADVVEVTLRSGPY